MQHVQGNRKRLLSSKRSPWERRPPFVIPSAAEGSAVLRTIPGNVFRQRTMALRPTQGDENRLKGTAFRVCVRTGLRSGRPCRGWIIGVLTQPLTPLPSPRL